MIKDRKTSSRLYSIFHSLGITATEERLIEEYVGSKKGNPYETVKLSYDDVLGIGYRYPHFKLPKGKNQYAELWHGDSYIYQNDVEWIRDDFYDYGILTRDADVTIPIRVYINDSIIHRYSDVKETEGDWFCYQDADVSAWPLKDHPHPDMCCYAIVDGKLTIPRVEWLDWPTVRFSVNYKRSAELIFADNLVGIYQAEAGKGIQIDSVESRKTYMNFWTGYDWNHKINSRFYPWISTDEDCILRVYDSGGNGVPHPEATRLMAYPEFFNVEDPYNTDNEYLNSLEYCDVRMYADDSDEVLMEKFASLAPYCYRAWESLYSEGGEQRDFIVCDNSKFGELTFVRESISLLSGETREAVISLVPCEEARDVLWHNGMICEDYEVLNLRRVDGRYIESDSGIPTYVFSADANPDKISLIKFNTAEDTVIVNLENYIDPDNALILHNTLNRYFRNLLVVRGQLMKLNDSELVEISRDEPSEKDERLWFQLLASAEPDEFEIRAIESIRKVGLSEGAVPELIAKGTMALDISDDGPQNYTSIVSTYFRLADKYKDSLVFQAIDNESTLSHEYAGIPLRSSLPDNPKINDIVMIPIDGSAVEGDATIDLPFTLSMGTPGNPKPGDYWMDEAPYFDGEGHDDTIITRMFEASPSLEELPSDAQAGDLIFDAGFHGGSDAPEYFQKNAGTGVFNPHVGYNHRPGLDSDLWYEFIGETGGRVCYADTESMVLRVDEHLVMVQFHHDNISAYLFDDVLMNFRGTLGVGYMGIVADLINSGTISKNDVNIFYARLMTKADEFDPKLKRLYTGKSYVVSAIEAQPRDYAIAYSGNIGRISLDYDSIQDMEVEEREDLWRHVIDCSRRNLPFVGEKCLLFVNGRFVPESEYEYLSPYRIRLIGFPEVIRCVDVMFSKRESYLGQLKLITAKYYPQEEVQSPPVIRHARRDYSDMIPVSAPRESKRCYYDVLIRDYILNGKLIGMLKYFSEHEDEFDEFRDDLIEKFHEISDLDLVDDRGVIDSRIVIPCRANRPIYEIR